MTPGNMVCMALLAGAVSSGAAAQLSDRPYDFPNRGGSGMSPAGKQAIILNEIDRNFTPDALMRAPSGDLLVPAPLPASADDDVPVLVAPFTGEVITPPYNQNVSSGPGLALGAGAFNLFFVGGSGRGVYLWNTRLSSVSVWTARVLEAGGFGYTNDAMNDWTAGAHMLGVH